MKKLLFLPFLALIPLFYFNAEISPNLSVNNSSIKYIQKNENTKFTQILPSTIALHYNGQQYIFKQKNSPNFYIDFSRQNIEQQIRKLGAREVYLKQINLGKTPIQALDYMLYGFANFYYNVASKIQKQFIPHSVLFNPNAKDMFTFTCGQDGLIIDEQSLALDILCGKGDITLKVDAQTNPCTLDEVKANTTLRASAQTSIAGSEAGRRFNVIKALNCFNGLVVEPGKIVSFNSILNERHNGIPYKEATVIVNGEFTKGVGGGICQASTTVFNAVLLSGLEIVEAHTHSLPVGYVERGFDATVNDSNLDLKFRNSTPYPIYFACGVQGANVYAKIYGQDMAGVTYEKVSDVEKIEPPEPKVIDDDANEYNLQEGEYYTKLYAQYGYKVNAYLVKHNKDGTSERTLLRRATYAPTQSIIYKGVKKAENEQ